MAMRCIVSFPGVMEHAQHVARSLDEADALDAFVTAFAFQDGSLIDQLIKGAPGPLQRKLRRELGRRTVSEVPADRVKAHGGLEVIRTLMEKLHFGPVMVDRMWDFASHRFDEMVAQRYVAGADAVVAFEYTALASFERARASGKARILHLPSLDNRAFHDIEVREKARWPELRNPNDSYFSAKFEARQARRLAEIQLADVIIANSTLTKLSHVAAGAPAEKVFVVPLAAPPPIEAANMPALDRPLTVIWSGSFMLRKGAQYLLDAWRTLAPGTRARLQIYGPIVVPDELLRNVPAGIEFMGAVPRSQMLAAYEAADVLIFPTLSDGFGMAVVEALSRGVPVITTDQAGAADLIEHGHNGLITPAADAAALTDALQWCLDDRAALRAMRPQALATAKLRQWPDYRRSHLEALDLGLRQAGYSPDFNLSQPID